MRCCPHFPPLVTLANISRLFWIFSPTPLNKHDSLVSATRHKSPLNIPEIDYKMQTILYVMSQSIEACMVKPLSAGCVNTVVACWILLHLITSDYVSQVAQNRKLTLCGLTVNCQAQQSRARLGNRDVEPQWWCHVVIFGSRIAVLAPRTSNVCHGFGPRGPSACLAHVIFICYWEWVNT